MRPRTMTLFAVQFAGGIAVELANTLIHWRYFQDNPQWAALAPATRDLTLYAGAVVGVAIPLLLLWATLRRMRVARWLTLGYVAIGLASTLLAALSGNLLPGVGGALSVATAALYLTAGLLLLHRDSRAWFRREPA